jgi:hypothetical protein
VTGRSSCVKKKSPGTDDGRFVAFADVQIVADAARFDVQRNHPGFAGSVGLPLLRMVEYGGDRR